MFPLQLVPVYFTIMLFIMGNSLLSTLVILRANLEQFSDTLIGFLGSAYFTGLVIGIFGSTYIIQKIGHVRAISIFCALAAISLLSQSIWISPWSWLFFRFMSGFMVAGFYTVIESLLNSEQDIKLRGTLFAVYMTTNQVSQAIGQQFLNLSPPKEATLFILSGILSVLALLPVLAVTLKTPVISSKPKISLVAIWKNNSLAFTGSLTAGLVVGVFWSLIAVYLQHTIPEVSRIPFVMSMTLLTSAFAQIPMNMLSRRFSKKHMLNIACLLGIAGMSLVIVSPLLDNLLYAGFFIFALGAFSIYTMSVGHLMESADPQLILSFSAGVFLVNGLGSIFSPLLVAYLMEHIGQFALPFALIGFLALPLIHSLKSTGSGVGRFKRSPSA